MAKSKSIKSGLMMEAKIIDLRRNDEGVAIALSDEKRVQPFVIYFDNDDEDLIIGDQVVVTIMKKLEV